jgi:PAS domain S-box-containing protein
MTPARKPHGTTRAKLERNLKRARAQLVDRRGQFKAEAIRRLGQAAESSREHYAELYDYAPFGHLTLDTNGVIRTLNLTAAALIDRPREHLIGCPFVVLVAPADRSRFLSHLSRLRRGQPHASTELGLSPVNGQAVEVQIVSVLRGRTKARGYEYQTALVDITERKRAEARTAAMARLGLLLSAASDPAAAARAIVDTAQELCGWDACFLLLHDAATGLVHHLVNMDTIKGQRVPVPPILQGRSPTPLIRRVLEEGPQLILRTGPDDKGPVTLPFGDTSRPSLSLMFVPVRQEDRNIGVLSIQSYQGNAYTPEALGTLQALADHVGGALARLQARADLARANEELERRVAERTAELQQYRDHLEVLVQQRTAELESTNEHLRKEIRNRELAEVALRHTANELKRSNAELEQFAYVASHDLQEPLRAVGGYVRLLEHRFPKHVDAKAREFIKGAAEGANRMEQQITDLLALSRVGSGGLKPQWTDLSVPLQAVLHRMQFAIRSADAKVACEPMPTLPVDAGQIEQVFQNLLANALKFCGDKPPEIHIGAHEEPDAWVIWVRDNGIGIGPQYFERIFQVFQRLHTRKKHPGTGIGLAICKKIIERHGGRIWLESEPGKGTTFYFSIPAKRE